MTFTAPLRSTVVHQSSTLSSKNLRQLISHVNTNTASHRFLSTATLARPCTVIAPATTVRFQQHQQHQQQQNRHFSLFGSGSSTPDILRIPKEVKNDIPDVLLHETHPLPMRDEFMGKKRLSTKDLEAIPIDLGFHREPTGISDWIAYKVVKSLRIPVDLFFRTKYIHRVVALETVAAV
ncbi:hypothetical protein BGZ94_008774, partial [Podila epigama]